MPASRKTHVLCISYSVSLGMTSNVTFSANNNLADFTRINSLFLLTTTRFNMQTGLKCSRMTYIVFMLSGGTNGIRSFPLSLVVAIGSVSFGGPDCWHDFKLIL